MNMRHLTGAGLLTLSFCAAACAAPDIQFHDIMHSAKANCRASSGGQSQFEPQLSGGNGFLNASHHVVSHAVMGTDAMASGHGAMQLTREENVIRIWGYATSSTFAQNDGVASVQSASGGAQLQFTLDRDTRFALRSCSIWQSDSPMGQAICILSDADGDLLFRHNRQDPNDCLNFNVVLGPGTYQVNAHAQLWNTNEGAGQIDEWAEIDVKFTLEEIVIQGDVDGDGDVDGEDLAKMLGTWGTNDPTTDFNGDGVVNGSDLAILLGNWS